jgi:predicted nucleic acid-binding protein
VFELWYGVGKSTRQEFNRQRLETFVAGPILVLPFEEADAGAAGSVLAVLVSRWQTRWNGMTSLTAGQALRHQLTLVTATCRTFHE